MSGGYCFYFACICFVGRAIGTPKKRFKGRFLALWRNVFGVVALFFHVGNRFFGVAVGRRFFFGVETALAGLFETVFVWRCWFVGSLVY